MNAPKMYNFNLNLEDEAETLSDRVLYLTLWPPIDEQYKKLC